MLMMLVMAVGYMGSRNMRREMSVMVVGYMASINICREVGGMEVESRGQSGRWWHKRMILVREKVKGRRY